MPSLATVVAKDGDSGTWHEVSVIVRKRIEIAIDCGCWRHQDRSHDLEMIITAGGVYLRPLGSNEHFREAGRAGPVAVCVTNQTRLE